MTGRPPKLMVTSPQPRCTVNSTYHAGPADVRRTSATGVPTATRTGMRRLTSCASGRVARVTHGYGTYPGQPYSLACSSVQQVVSVQVESIDVTSAKLGTSPNPPPFEGGTNWVFRVTNSPSPDKHAAVLYKDVADGSFNVQDFDVTLTATLSPSGLTTHPLTFHWEKISGPGSGELLTPGSTSAVYRNPGQGGVYRFRLTVRKGGRDLAFGEANLVLPLAGAEMNAVVRTNLSMADSFVSRVCSNYSPRVRTRRDLLDKWFVTWNAGDYVGRPDNNANPSVWYYGQVATANQTDPNFGLGVVCTWKGRPVRMSKITNFVVAYTMQQLGMNYLRAKLGIMTIIATEDGTTASKSWDTGWDYARDGGDYETVVSELSDFIWKTKQMMTKPKTLAERELSRQ